jgi:hypothetical protein
LLCSEGKVINWCLYSFEYFQVNFAFNLSIERNKYTVFMVHVINEKSLQTNDPWALFCLTDVNIITRPNNTLKGHSILLSGVSVLAQFKVTVNRYLFSAFVFKF